MRAGVDIGSLGISPEWREVAFDVATPPPPHTHSTHVPTLSETLDQVPSMNFPASACFTQTVGDWVPSPRAKEMGEVWERWLQPQPLRKLEMESILKTHRKLSTVYKLKNCWYSMFIFLSCPDFTEGEIGAQGVVLMGVKSIRGQIWRNCSAMRAPLQWGSNHLQPCKPEARKDKSGRV